MKVTSPGAFRTIETLGQAQRISQRNVECMSAALTIQMTPSHNLFSSSGKHFSLPEQRHTIPKAGIGSDGLLKVDLESNIGATQLQGR